jgi:hypothetical protein
LSCLQYRLFAMELSVSGNHMEEPGVFLPTELLACASMQGNEYACRKRDLLRVAAAAREAGLAANGWQVQFRSPDGSCELCWDSFEPAAVSENESWDEYLSRSWNETLQTWEKLFDNKDFIEEGRKIFSLIQEMEDEKVLPRDLLWFVLYFRQEKPIHSPSSPPETSY